ncbi:MAG: invasion associated locus B family protein [Pseudomonadota bacterium]
MKPFTIRALFIAASLIALPALAQTQSSEPNNNSGPKWLVNCSNQTDPLALTCSMSQSLLQANTGQRIITATIFKNAQGAYSLRLQLPHGLDLKKGVTLAIDNGAATSYTIDTADASGSYTLIPLDNAIIDAMKAGNIGAIGISNISGNNINLEISLNGFSSSFALLSK